MLTYSIPHIPASLNKFAGRQNVWEYREAKRLWKDICAAYCLPKPSKPLERAVVTITYYFKDRRRRDLDNLVKPVTDGLVAAGIIRDDCYQCIDIVLRGGYDKDNPRTEITIWEVESCEP